MIIVAPKFSKADIARMMGEQRQRIELAITMLLKRVGEKFVTDARNTNTYQDQTGNLRSSIGYIILKDGKVLAENFAPTGSRKKYGGKKGEDGTQKAKEVANMAKVGIGKGWALICVAGMDYALAVEAKGYDVITNSTITAVRDLQVNLKRLAKKIAA